MEKIKKIFFKPKDNEGKKGDRSEESDTTEYKKGTEKWAEENRAKDSEDDDGSIINWGPFGEDGEAHFLALIYDSDRYNIEKLPLKTEKFYTTTDLKIKEEGGAAHEEHKVELQKLHQLDGDISDFDIDLIGIWEEDEKKPETWESTRGSKFNGQSIYSASHESTMLDSLESMFSSLGLGGGGGDWGLVYVIIIAVALAIGAFFLLSQMGILGALPGM